MYHVFFTHSFVDGHLGCFHVLFIVSSTAVTIEMHESYFCRTTPVAYGNSWIRVWIGASVASLCHSHNNAKSELHLWPVLQLVAMPLLHPLSEVSNPHPNGHYIRFLTHWTPTGTPYLFTWEFSPDICLGMGLLHDIIWHFYIYVFEEPPYCFL